MSAPDLYTYDRIVIAFSGGKDSIACLLHLLDLGVPRSKIELHHHDVDGHGRVFMDWPITPAYCKAVAKHFDLPLYFSWKEGGFEAEMLRDNTPSLRTAFETAPDGPIEFAGGGRGSTLRMEFPQVGAINDGRWCSPLLKIDVLAVLIRNCPRFANRRTLVITGERAQESKARSKYKTFEPHRADLRDGGRIWRQVDVWRPVHAWDEQQVWEIMARYKVIPHPAYYLGWGRLSCRACIFGSADQWATIQALYPDIFEAIATYEEAFGKTIQRKVSVRERAARGTPFAAALVLPGVAALANSPAWIGPITDESWSIPAGAFSGSEGGPT